MTALSLSDLPPPGALARLSAASPLLWRTSIAFLAAFAACALLEVIDPRLFNGIGVWIKPAKFFLSLSIHMLTLGFGLALLPEDVRHRLSATLITVTMASMAVLEMLYITFRAARAEASHFNQSSELAGILYSAMGLGSALMMVVTIALGVIVLRAGPRTLLGRATGTGFILAGVLTLIVGFTLGGMGSHWIGGDRTDATGLPVLGWSTTGGDLRSVHFAGLHIMQALQLAACFGGRTLVWATAVGGVAATVALYALALAGIPLFAL